MDLLQGNWKLQGFVTLLCCCSALFSCSTAVTNPNEVIALLSIQQAFNGNPPWPSGTDPCASAWIGVTCDGTNTTVTSLVLSSMSLKGTLSPAIGALSNLTDLEISYNPGISGPLPPELGNLTQLTTLSLQSCSYTGRIPSTLSNLIKLTFLALNGNQLTESIPSGLGALTQLYWFDLSINNLTGSLPVSTTSPDGHGLDQLQKAQHFHLYNNSLSGSIPPELGGTTTGKPLGSLIHLLLDSNAFTGTIPDSLGNITTLLFLNLMNNNLVGPIPPTLNNITSPSGTLQQLQLGNNYLNGTIPNLSALHNLTLIDLSNNRYDPQPYPFWLNVTTNLETITLQKSNLVGQLPADVLSYPLLQVLNLADNGLNGTFTIPATIGGNLSLVSIQNNSISSINQLSTSTSLSTVQFAFANNPICSVNSLAKPYGCSNETTALETWSSPYSGQNSCNGMSCPGLTLNPQNCTCAEPLTIILVIQQPSFSTITDSLMALLQGYLYSGLGLHSQQVWITEATFTENGRVNVTILFFPFDSSTMLDQATQTNITSTLAEQKVNLTYLFQPYYLAFANGLTVLGRSSSLAKGAIIGIVVGAVVVVLVLAALTIYVVMLRRRAKKLEEMSKPFASWGEGGGDNGEAPKLKGARRFYFAELKKATDNFSESNEIGAGGYGKVYKGVLPEGDLVAVKRAQKESMQGAQEFKTEIEILSRVHHRNLVNLVGFCYEQGEQMLVYEFMVNGTLREWLLGKMKEPLDWNRRLQIAVGSARGLTYLHENIDQPIIHRDVKSANILLDDKLTAKVADFGLSKLAPDADEKQQHVSTQVKGTLGYLDPQYYTTQQLSDKSDVYSYGVVLLEILSGHQPIERGKYIVREVRLALDRGGIQAVRPLLDPVLADIPMQNIEPVLDLALMCVEEKAVDRPSMNEVVKSLEAIVAQNPRDSAVTFADTTSSQNPTAIYDNQDLLSRGNDPSFQYSGGYAPKTVEPK
ncbi:unnamed protein product [Sphagnum troendelagicum]|uniref:Protein kinase domain-containing protein n=1 Tax=Sphagnum troendelagicum TaxID=128251 RepID=A0ABP0V2D0_9BRYO